MKQKPFVNQHGQLWEKFEQWLEYQAASRKTKKLTQAPKIDMPHVYRQICHHLALARSRLYSPLLIERLNRLVIRGHRQLYSHRSHFLSAIAHYVAGGFPALIRKEWRLVSLAAVLFFGPFLISMIVLQFYPDMVYTVLDGATIRGMESMYSPDLHERLGREREADSDILMFGFYIRNNTSIDFQVFSGGILFGVGTLFFLLLNGLFLGIIAGHLTQLGYIDTFWGFVAGHSALELSALVLGGAAGFKLAQALIAPGRKSRLRALIDNGQIAVKILYGTAAMTIMAAFVEAFWSSIAWMPLSIKYSVGIFMWLLVLTYFIFMGRDHRAIR